MHTAATWTDLAAHARFAADAMRDPAERRAMLEVVETYEWQAREAASRMEATRCFGSYQSRVW